MSDKVQLIKEKIERLKEENSIGLCEYDAGYCNGVGETCDEILQFIDSLPLEKEKHKFDWLEKQGEQKPTDNTQPKFKVGDWITNGTCIIKITSVDDRYYWHDNDCVGGDIESIDKEYHLWTIQDASEDLEQSARHYLLHKHISPLNDILHQCDLKIEMQYHKDIENAFKAGAEWQRNKDVEKMMKTLIGGEIVKDIHNQLRVKSEPLNDIFWKFGDKVKIIILNGE